MPFLDNVVFLDLETTGFFPGENVIIEVGAVKVQGGSREEFQRLVNPGKEPVPLQILELCQGLKIDELKKAPPLDQVMEELKEFIGDMPLVCHNAAFESAFLEKALDGELPNAVLDSLELFCLFKPHFPYQNLDYLARCYLELNRGEEHRALADARDTMEAVEKLLQELQGQDAELLNRALDLMQGTDWPWMQYLQQLPLALSTQKASREKQQGEPAGSGAFSKTRSGNTGIKSTLQDVSSILHDSGRWQEKFPAYQAKEQQVELAEKIADAFQENSALFAEAPTGSGKTLAYLLVAMLWAAEHNERVYISTNTRNLQEQIKEELPRLAAVLGDDRFPAADIKGISNYVCRARVEGEINRLAGAEDKEKGNNKKNTPGSSKREERLARLFLHNWARRTETGEVEEIPYWFYKNYTPLQRLLRLVRCSREECQRYNCNYFGSCFYQNKVEEMHRSLITVMNHSLLLTWPPSYPEIKKLIIDEAHNLEEKAFDSFTAVAESEELKNTMFRLSRREGVEEGLLYNLRHAYRRIHPGASFKETLQLVEQIKEKLSAVSSELKRLAQENQTSGGNTEHGFTSFLLPGWQGLKQEAADLSSLLENLGLQIKNTLEEIVQHDDTFQDKPLYHISQAYYRNCGSLAETLKECFNGERDDVCRYVEVKNQGHYWKFCLAPLDVSRHFYDKVLAEAESVILTSATLSEGGSYERLKDVLGFNLMEEVRDAEPGKHVFNYRDNCVLAMSADSPGHKDPGFVDYTARGIIRVAKLLGGRTMALFSNNRRMQEVYRKVEPELEKEGIITLAGHQHSRNNMAGHLRQKPHTVLLGSRSFFEGVDISGPALSCIIIDKLPFPFPGEPLHQARERYLKELGRDPFRELSVSTMLRTFRQQFGRLIRSEEDFGFVVVMSQLNSSSRYFRAIQNELPPVRVVEGNLEKILGEMEARFHEWHQK